MTPDQMDSYFQRIGWRPAAEKGPEILRALHCRHPCAFAFENLTPLLGQPVALDTDILCGKMLAQERGGYCFEQNCLMAGVLRALGFTVEYLAARVHWQNPPDNPLPRTHMLLKVDTDGEQWLVDVGFGGLTPLMPLRLTTETEQSGSHETFLLTEQAGLYTLSVEDRSQSGDKRQAGESRTWKAMYSFDLQPQQPADLEMMNWYVSSHPQSRFIRQLLAGRREAGHRYALLDNRLTTYWQDGRREERLLETPAELRAVLRDQLRIRLPESAEFESLLAGLIRRGQSTPDAQP